MRMPENPLEQARFDHVDKGGDLIFAVGGLRFRVHVDDTLERAVLEAKQIHSEAHPQQTPAAATLPISQIQSLIRAGADPGKVAEQFGLSEALVRRFSSAVETEKQYAIEQFLTLPAPKNSRMRTIAELIEHTLATARIGMETVSWQATRRGLEPWRIVATFPVSGREMKAEWTWNMHGNAVACVNATANQLLGERVDAVGGPYAVDSIGRGGFGDLTASANLPGDSLRSARIERTVSQWADDGHAHDIPSRAPLWNPPHSDASSPVSEMPDPSEELPRIDVSEAPASGVSETPSKTSATSVPRQDAETPAHSEAELQSTRSETQNMRSSTAATDHGTQHDREEDQRHPFAKTEKRKAGRSPMPSWDEILFGE